MTNTLSFHAGLTDAEDQALINALRAAALEQMMAPTSAHGELSPSSSEGSDFVQGPSKGTIQEEEVDSLIPPQQGPSSSDLQKEPKKRATPNRTGTEDTISSTDSSWREGALKREVSFGPFSWEIGRAVQQECRDRSRMPSSA
eukprot:TRINITY_DN10801_c0_g1_i1.p1 TRINITY_DN10801_c0_g1~~TRINITY_DN10801_c0_g1_i1.p1  ORF type:complete len:143 (+),score=19.67 TRINITY_DN10801_c0_g1_i1:252-680(+)